jgi:hypothetical protein
MVIVILAIALGNREQQSIGEQRLPLIKITKVIVSVVLRVAVVEVAREQLGSRQIRRCHLERNL